MKFETKLRLHGGEFASFYSTIKRAEDYYKCLANAGSDLNKNATNILYWRIIFGLKQRLETILVKKQNQLVSEIKITLDDIESTCLLNAILPPDNNAYNEAVIYRARNEVYKSLNNHIFNLYPSPTFSLPANHQPAQEKGINQINMEDAIDKIINLTLFDYQFTIQSFVHKENEGRVLVKYESLEQALEDGSRLEPISLMVEDLGVYTIIE